MARLAPAGSPAHAIEHGLYVERPGQSAVSLISARLELDPAAAFLLVGAVGSGKTTELLMTAKKLSELDDVRAFFIDVSAMHDIKKMHAGTLIAVAGLKLAEQLSDDEEDVGALAARNELLEIAHGYGYFEPDDDDELPSNEEPPHDWIDVPGAVERPKTEAHRIASKVKHRSQLLFRMCAPLRKDRPHIVLVFDSLDRKINLDEFKQIFWEDVAALQRVGVGVLLTAPLAIMYGQSRIMVQEFFQDRSFLQTAVDVQEGRGIDFLTRVIRARAPADMIPDDVCRTLAQASGGALRDLIALGHSSIQEAYGAGADEVKTKHVERAAKNFGRQFLVGLSETGYRMLSDLHKNGKFFGTTDEELDLLATRRIIVYYADDGDMRYAVHPTIEPLLDLSEE